MHLFQLVERVCVVSSLIGGNWTLIRRDMTCLPEVKMMEFDLYCTVWNVHLNHFALSNIKTYNSLTICCWCAYSGCVLHVLRCLRLSPVYRWSAMCQPPCSCAYHLSLWICLYASSVLWHCWFSGFRNLRVSWLVQWTSKGLLLGSVS